MTFVIVMGFHQIIVVMNGVKRHTYIHTYIHTYMQYTDNELGLQVYHWSIALRLL